MLSACCIFLPTPTPVSVSCLILILPFSLGEDVQDQFQRGWSRMGNMKAICLVQNNSLSFRIPFPYHWIIVLPFLQVPKPLGRASEDEVRVHVSSFCHPNLLCIVSATLPPTHVCTWKHMLLCIFFGSWWQSSSKSKMAPFCHVLRKRSRWMICWLRCRKLSNPASGRPHREVRCGAWEP